MYSPFTPPVLDAPITCVVFVRAPFINYYSMFAKSHVCRTVQVILAQNYTSEYPRWTRLMVVPLPAMHSAGARLKSKLGATI